jgi:rhamnogalacturonan endolyase
VTWTPPRTAATLWEIGVPDRDAHEFLNGDSLYAYWATNYVDYATEFPKGVTFAAGKDSWSKVWNWSLMNDGSKGWATSVPWTVDFNLPKAPTTGTQGRFYLALASSYSSQLAVSLNGTDIGNFSPGNASDAVVRLGSHGAFWDTQILFAANLLKAGANTLSIGETKAGESATVAWDYLRLEADGTGITTGIAPRTGARSVSLRGSVLEGDGLHDLVLIGPSGRVLGRTAAGGTLDLSGLSRGTYFARCAGETLPIAWTR